MSLVRRQNEGSFGCEAFASLFGQPNVPECVSAFFIFLLCLYAAKISLSYCRCFFLRLACNARCMCCAYQRTKITQILLKFNSLHSIYIMLVAACLLSLSSISCFFNFALLALELLLVFSLFSLKLQPTVEAICSKGLRATFLSAYTEV